MKLILYTCIIISSISLITAVELDATCTSNTTCTTANAFCDTGKCQCDAPAYFPCQSRCDVNPSYAYAGDSCSVDGNCVANAACSNKRCQCKTGFTAKNGLCYKALNVTCADSTECWSQYCYNSRCACEVGYSVSDDGVSCKQKLVNIYNTWSEANQQKEFCVDDNSCKDVKAHCVSGPQAQTSKFCKCPDGYTVVNQERCDAIVSSLLSPLDTPQSVYEECGLCADDNAACMTAGEEETCWCRSGYAKTNNKCEKERSRKPAVLFPNSKDVSLHDYSAGCLMGSNNSTRIENGLCVCAPGYELVNRGQPCVKIQRTWINSVYEYGLCTRVTHQDETIAVDGLCPEPLKCEARRDKHVCSCGKDKFQDLYDTMKCVYFIGRTTNSSSDSCPTRNAFRNTTTGRCECLAGYRAVDQNRRCELTLSGSTNVASCNSTQFNDTICKNTYGRTAFQCGVGECRCSGNQSFPNSNRTRCYAVVNTELSQPIEDCPPFSTFQTDRCVCAIGYRPSSNNRECVRATAQLSEYAGNASNTTGDLTTADCEQLYRGPVEVYRNNICQCKSNAFVNDKRDGCWYRLSVILPSKQEAAHCPPDSEPTEQLLACQCEEGLVPNGNKCVQITERVYNDTDSTAPNITGLTTNGCIRWFGRGSEKSTRGDYCICKPEAYAVFNNKYCFFLLNVKTNDIKGLSDCPSNSFVDPQGLPSACVCNSGYRVSADNKTCVPTNIVLSGALNRNGTTPNNCTTIKDIDCTNRFGSNAFCQANTCYCDRRLSFVGTRNLCESLSRYKYPGLHELTWYSCTTDSDCTGKNVVCENFNGYSEYKVCQCKADSLLDPIAQACVESRCPEKCDTAANFECRGYTCVCKTGYYLNGGVCSAIPSKLELNQRCNSSFASLYDQANENSTLECNSVCGRAQCKAGYRPSGSECVKPEFSKDKCVFQESICQAIDVNSVCNREENLCTCRPSYYLLNDKCVPSVGSACQTNDECGADMECKGRRCSCLNGELTVEEQDSFGRPIKRCVISRNNGINRLQFSSILLFFIALVCMLLN